MENLDDLKAFLLVAQTGSFTKAAAQVGVSQSALSYTVRTLEERLKVKLLERTTRSVASTAAGERLRQKIAPLLAGIDEAVLDLGSDSGKMGGKLRINGNEHALNYVLKGRLIRFAQDYPDVELEIIAENRFSDIVSERFDIGIRLGDKVAKDMIAVKVSADLKMQTAASPDYLARHGTPQTPFDLSRHHCLAYRLPTLENLMAWEFTDPVKNKTVKIQPQAGGRQGQFVSNQHTLLIAAATAGQGLVWLPEDVSAEAVQQGKLTPVLADWAIRYSGYYLYYPSRRADSPVFAALVAALRVE
ncbi:LysR family transcriptional regulator [Pasteurellaceae bacterium USgator11]|nr:LysR family transcriptional regulator [Pasteurellaceae bacterium UScroc12]TNG98089.1 LysR family transcriptional regulator [Pasteurellaceae bacterium USgator41]TNG99034.1 LysR family transcriptional regulator [Pasteurellaceae bacterium UScroc31]TNG99880.1 LysR family transcriptional regulator [Pasteurellaceae bacterium USgator11]